MQRPKSQNWKEMEWADLLAHREFWLFLFRHDEDNPLYSSAVRKVVDDMAEQLKGQSLEIALPRRYVLSLRFTGYTDELYLKKGKWQQKLGWNDLAHFHRDVFRWPEFTAIVHETVQVFDLTEAQVYCLLLNFLSVSDIDSIKQINDETILRLAQLGLFSKREVRHLARWISRGNEFFSQVRWEYSAEKGWLQTGEGYSMRNEFYHFDFGEFRKFIRWYNE